MGKFWQHLTGRLCGEMILFLVLLLALPVSVIAQGAPHRAGLVIRFGDGSVITRCVSFIEPSLTGLELLTRAGLPMVVDTTSLGARVCKIDREGCNAGQSCWCQCEGSTCAYWQYFFLQAGAWKYSTVGAGIHQVTDGAVEGWAWGNNVAPPVMTLDQICAASVTTPAPVAPTARPSATIAPSPTLAPTATPRLVMPTEIAQATVPASPPTSLPTTAPTLPASPTITPTLIPPPQNTGVPSPVASYVFFGVIVLGLGAWLLIQSRRKAAKRTPR